LPIHGVNGQAASLSFDDFRAWLKEQQAKFPSAELWEGSSVEEYLRKLREVHAEPELVRVQVDLNKREGGIDEHFKEHCADSRNFVHTLLDLALQSTKGEETAGVLGIFLAEWQNVGHLEDETVFCEEFAIQLATLAGAHDRWSQAAQRLSAVRLQGAGLWRSLKRQVDELNRQKAEVEGEFGTAKAEAIVAKRNVDNTYHHFVSYELEWLGLRATEAANAAEDADGRWQDARTADRLARLALLLGEIERRRRDLEAKRRVLQEKQAELAPQLAKLHALGAAFAARLCRDVANVEGDSAEASEALREAQDHRGNLELLSKNLAVESSNHKRTLSDIKEFFDRRRSQRDHLANRACLEANERAEDGRVRWQRRKESEEANVAEKRELQQQLAKRLSESNAERTRIEGEAGKAEGEIRQLQLKLDQSAAERCAIVRHDLVLAHFGEDFDPLRHAAEEDVARKQSDVLHAWLNLRLDFAALERNHEGIARHRVLPPPRDVESVLQRLLETGVEALPGLRYLAETCGCEEAERLISAEPGRYAGILVAPKDWEKLATLAWPEITHPVVLSPFPEKFLEVEHPGRRVVLPTRAAFDKAEASRRSLRLDDETVTTKRQIDGRRIEYDGLGHVLTLIRAFVLDYGDGKLSSVERDLQAKQRHAEALRGRSEELKDEIDAAGIEQQSARDAERESLDAIQMTIQPALTALDRFIADYEHKVEEARAREQAIQARLAAIEREDAALVTQREDCERALNVAQQQVFQLKQQLNQLGDELGGIHYREAEVDLHAAAQPIEALRASYHQQRQLYEGQQDLQAQVEISAAEQVLDSKRREFSIQLKDETETRVRAVAEPLDYAESKLREHAERVAQVLDHAVGHRAAKIAERETAKRESGEKERNAPEGGKRRFPEGESRPATSAEAFALFERGRALHEQRQATKQEIDERVRCLGDRINELQNWAANYEGQGNLLDHFKEVEAGFVEIPKEFGDLRRAVGSVQSEEKAALSDEQRVRRERTERIGAARVVTLAPRFTERKVSLAKRFEAYTDDSLLAELVQIREDLDQRIASNRDRLLGLKETREQLVHMMDGLADEILALLRSIEKVSRLPEEGMGPWSGKPFIHISFHQPEDSERQVALRGILEELVELRRARQDGALDTDSSGLIRLIADRLVCDKRIRVQILKPTPVRTDTYEDVEMLRHYSGGEGITVAILMYLTIVQLRAQSSQGSRRGLQDAGFLLLDNPFGKCNREDLVRMQVQLAEQLRVQLIVLTGLREPVIMMSYPRRVRLVNDLLNRVTGAKHVRSVESDGQITAVENLRRFNLNGP
jgi:DNA repair exonuclease SbcCD ATPase subunit